MKALNHWFTTTLLLLLLYCVLDTYVIVKEIRANLGTIQIQTSGIYTPYNIERKLVKNDFLLKEKE